MALYSASSTSERLIKRVRRFVKEKRSTIAHWRNESMADVLYNEFCVINHNHTRKAKKTFSHKEAPMPALHPVPECFG